MFHAETAVDGYVKQALRDRASDIHAIPTKEGLVIKFRVDGYLRYIDCISYEYREAFTNRIKIMSHMDIGEKRVPQDGRWDYEGMCRLRISALPTIYGEKIVIRIVQESDIFSDLAALGMGQDMIQSVQALLQRPYGLFLVTGPTGSGKSSTLHTLMQLMDRERENVISLEDPVEHPLEGATQVEINEKAGFTYEKALRATLRQDPDTIMVGEIRDLETARLAMRAALTGHKVFSTLHTNDTRSVWERLIDMGVEPFLVKAAWNGALAQRLVRRICLKCKGRGCFYCNQTGYYGRIGIFELLSLPEERVAREDIQAYITMDLEESGIQAMRRGLTTKEELLRAGLGKEALYAG